MAWRMWCAQLLLMAAVALGSALVRNDAVAQSVQEDPAARRLYEHADALVAAGDLAAAAEEFDLLIAQFPGSRFIDGGLLARAQLYARAGDRSTAQQTIERLVTDHPRTDGAAGGAVLLVELQREDATTLEEIEALRESVLRVPLLYARDAFPELRWRAAASVLAGELALESGDPVGAAGHFGMALHDVPAPEWERRARLGLARSFLATGDWLAAAQVLQPVAAVAGAVDPVAGAARQMMGLIHRIRIRTRDGGMPWVASRTLRSAGGAFDHPVGVAASAGGTVFIGDEGVPFVVEIDAGGEVLWQQRPMSSRGHPWFGRDGTVFFPTEGSVIEPASRTRHTFSELRRDKQEPVAKILAGARGIFGEWILVHDDGKRVSVFDRQKRFVRSQMPAERAQIADVEVDGQGTIYLLDRRESRVFTFSSSGVALGLAAKGSWKRAQALALDEFGNVYVLDRDAKRIDVFDPHGQRMVQLGPSLPGGVSLDDPRDLAVDGAGRLFIADRRLKAVVVVE